MRLAAYDTLIDVLLLENICFQEYQHV